MVEEILTLLGRLVVELRLEVDVLGRSRTEFHLLDIISVAEIEVLHILVGYESATSDALHHQRGLVLLQIVAPQVVVAFE